MHFYKKSSKNIKKVLLVSGRVSAVWKSTFFARFSLSGSRCMSDAITSTKLEQTGEVFWDSPCRLSAWVSAFWARRMKVKWGLPCLSADCKILTDFVYIYPKCIRLESLVVDFWWYLRRRIFLEGFVDHIIYWDNIANWRSFIYRGLATLTEWGLWFKMETL